ncbi:hypothetical protein WJX82_005683 [Trebouxia sp. C0006]
MTSSCTLCRQATARLQCSNNGSRSKATYSRRPCIVHAVEASGSLVCVRRRHLAQETASSSIAPDFAENIKTGKNRCQKHRIPGFGR